MNEAKMPDSYVETVVKELTSEGTTLYSKDGETLAIVHHRDPHNISSWEDNPSISLGELEEIIAELTAAGANRVQIFYQGDHSEYHFVGTNLQQEFSTEDQLKLRISELNEDLAAERHHFNEARKHINNMSMRVANAEKLLETTKKELEKIVLQKVGEMTQEELCAYLKQNGI